ncbi:MAG: hypothetical protein ACEQSR_14875, partial [Candidatus Methylacidiphilales bacterium]
MKIKITAIVISIGILFVLGSYYFNKFYRNNVQLKPIYYCYDSFGKAVNSALVIEDLDFKDSLIKYYNQTEKGINPIFNFPLKTLPQFEPVYLLEFSDDSTIAYIASFYDRGALNGGSFNKYYVDTRTLHKY